MPSGYTAGLKDGKTFKEFALDCARAFGALVTMRDEPFDAKIPDEFKPHKHYAEKLSKAEKLVEKLNRMTDKQADKEAAKDFEEAKAQNKKYIEENNSLKLKYEEKLREAEAWTPPTPDHAPLKSFMISQITESIRFDCNNEYYIKNAPKLESGTEWKTKQLMKAHKDCIYYAEEKKKEEDRCKSRTDWVQALKKSL